MKYLNSMHKIDLLHKKHKEIPDSNRKLFVTVSNMYNIYQQIFIKNSIHKTMKTLFFTIWQRIIKSLRFALKRHTHSWWKTNVFVSLFFLTNTALLRSIFMLYFSFYKSYFCVSNLSFDLLSCSQKQCLCFLIKNYLIKSGKGSFNQMLSLAVYQQSRKSVKQLKSYEFICCFVD